jgi:hypothetical protein
MSTHSRNSYQVCTASDFSDSYISRDSSITEHISLKLMEEYWKRMQKVSVSNLQTTLKPPQVDMNLAQYRTTINRILNLPETL